MDVGVELQVLSPGVEHGQEADLGPEMSMTEGIAG